MTEPTPAPSLADLQASTEGLFAATLGIRFLEATPRCIKAEMTVTREMCTIPGVVLLIAEIFVTNSFFIPFSVAAFIVVGLTFFNLLPVGILWQGLAFAIFGVCLIPICRKLLAKFTSTQPDINQY